MKETKTKYLARVSSLAMGVGLLASAGLTTTTSVFAAGYTPKTYKTNKFDAAYSRGILYRLNENKLDENDPNVTIALSGTAPATSCHTGQNTADGFTYHYCDNSSLNEDIYITVQNAAIYMDKYIDVREYIWADQGEWAAHVGGKGGVAITGGSTTPSVIYRQLRFYEAGTNKEISFKGVISFTDIDEDEGFEFNSKKGFHEAFIPTDGNVSAETTSDSTDGSTWYDFRGTQPSEPGTPPQLYVEVSGSSQSRLEFNEILGSHDGGTQNTAFSKVEYEIEDGSKFSVANPSTNIVVTYGTLSPLASPATIPSGYEFNGWYSDEDMTTKASAPLTVNTAKTKLYGEFKQKTSGGGEEEGGEGEKGKDDDKKGGSIATPDTGASTSNSDGLSGGKAMIAPILLVSLAALLGTGFAIKAKSKKKVMKFGR